MGPFRDGWTKADVDVLLAGDEAADLLYVPIVVGMAPPDCRWAEGVCVRLARHSDPQVRLNALLGLAHLARVCRRLDEPTVRPVIEAALATHELRGQAGDVADDLEMFLGWRFTRPKGGD